MVSDAEVLIWQHFFLEAGIPRGVATKYSKAFAEQRIQHSVLDDLDKSTLKELGISIVGDQLAVLRHIRNMRQKKAEPMDTSSSSSLKNVPSSTKGEAKAAQFLAPDRDDVYHVRLPSGTTPKTKAIMQKHTMLKSAGILKRGFDGVRKSGNSLPNQKLKTVRPSPVLNEVSSTTDDLYGRLGVQGLISDQLPHRNACVQEETRIVSKDPRNLFERAVSESIAETVFCVKLAPVEERVDRPRFRRISADLPRSRLDGVAKNAITKTRYKFVGNGGAARGNFQRRSVFDRLS